MPSRLSLKPQHTLERMHHSSLTAHRLAHRNGSATIMEANTVCGNRGAGLLAGVTGQHTGCHATCPQPHLPHRHHREIPSTNSGKFFFFFINTSAHALWTSIEKEITAYENYPHDGSRLRQPTVFALLGLSFIIL